MLTPTQIYGYARGAGFSPAKAVIATAVALAESHGNTEAHCLNCVPGVSEDSRGLWQINVAPNAHPDLKALNLYDPATNARAAFQVSSGGKSFAPWSTYTSGADSTYLTDANNASQGDPVVTAPPAASNGGGATVSTVGLNANPFDAFGIPSTISSTIGKDALRVVIEGVLIFGGAALVVVGLYRTVQPAVQKVANVTTKAAAAAAIA